MSSSAIAAASSLFRDLTRRPARMLAGAFGFDLVKRRPELEPSVTAFEHLMKLRDAILATQNQDERRFILSCVKSIDESTSQIFQDIFALHVLGQKPNGFFVEFGATNGVRLSNSYLLEKKFGWTGILSEPARTWAQALKANRQCAVDLRCVWTKTGEKLNFVETSDAELSTIDPFMAGDAHAENRLSNQRYEVETISLNDLLRTHRAPRDIDYLSIDTEGSEFMILSHFDFDEFNIKVITVEHNNVDTQREQIRQLLVSKRYRRMFEKFSQWDDWYVREAH